VQTLVALLRIWTARLAFTLARPFPLQPRVVLATSHADRIGGNLAFIRDELDRRTPRIPYVVLAHRASAGWRGRIAAAVHGARASVYLATSRVFIIDDYFFPLYAVRPRRGTRVVQTWHAGVFKKVGLSLHDKRFGAATALTRRVRIHSNYDVCLVSSEGSARYYAEAFGQPLDRFVWHLGMPRTDIFFGGERIDRVVAGIRERYRIPGGRRVVLYAPTFRGDSVFDARAPEDLDLGLLRAKLGEDHVLLLRLHPFVRGRMTIDDRLRDFVIDVSDHPDINELMFVADVLVTDYSSSIYEFSLLGRPMAFFAPDHEVYERERGLYVDYRSFVPGPIHETTESLAAWLRAGEFDVGRVERFRQEWFAVADGRSSARFVDEVVLPALA
jgi:teichoic acid ribitol-phosphate primase